MNMKPDFRDWWNLADSSLKMNLLRSLGWKNPDRIYNVTNMSFDNMLEALSTSERSTVKKFYKDATLSNLASLAHGMLDLAKYS